MFLEAELALIYVDIMEIISSLFYLRCITTFEDKTIPLSQLAKGFERLFNFKFSDIYKKEEKVLKRKPNKLTGFLDRLWETIKRKSKDDGFQP